jgi:hypothetical protein
MTTSVFQWIVDNAVDLSINKRAVVAQTVSRDQTVRATSRGGQIWRFTITPSSGITWVDSRPYIELLDKADRFTPGTITFGNNPGLSYLFGAQTTTPPSSASWTQGSDAVTLSGGSLIAGDLIQFGANSRVYSAATSGTAITLNRPALDVSGSGSVVVGANCAFKIICTQFPEWRIDPTDRCVKWSGSFVFFEELA